MHGGGNQVAEQFKENNSPTHSVCVWLVGTIAIIVFRSTCQCTIFVQFGHLPTSTSKANIVHCLMHIGCTIFCIGFLYVLGCQIYFIIPLIIAVR